MATKTNYKMSKQNKLFLSRISDPHERGEIKKIIVAADVHAQVTPRRDPTEKERAQKNKDE